MARSYTLRDIPDEVFKIVQKEQSDVKQKRGNNSFSFEKAIYKMIKDYQRCRDNNPDFKPEPV